MTTLETEIGYFNEHRTQWCDDGHEGQWAVILDTRLIGFYSDLDHAYKSGTAESGKPSGFLVKQVLREEPIETVQRIMW